MGRTLDRYRHASLTTSGCAAHGIYGMSGPSQASPICGGYRELAVVGGPVAEYALVASADLQQAKALKYSHRALVGIKGLSPDLLQAKLVEAMVKARGRSPAPQPLAPTVPLADDKADLAPVRLVSVEIDVANQDTPVDHPEPDQVRRP
jgi:hypothetical protein